mmetsp:Transcript_18974/g.27479  ORF Transcript_18974/g.27479 Transcript_18974/m.27479 type:complete len:101 (-) Transcript_18974:1456-1758(-)
MHIEGMESRGRFSAVHVASVVHFGSVIVRGEHAVTNSPVADAAIGAGRQGYAGRSFTKELVLHNKLFGLQERGMRLGCFDSGISDGHARNKETMKHANLQ